jgi:hypothetical protein
MKLENGDAFEIEQREWLRANLPLYETVWAEFIGHDNHGRPLPLSGLTTEQDKNRKKFYQAHYSMALSCFQIDTLCADVDALVGTPDSVQKYIREISLLNSFVSLVGNVYDMIKDIAEALSGHDPIRAPFHKFFGFRSHALHAARIPLQRDECGLKVPQISWEVKQEGDWNDAINWDDVDWSKSVYLTDLCRKVRGDLFDTLNTVYPTIRSKAHDYFGQKIECKNALETSSINSLSAAYTFFPSISGSANLP